MSANSANLTNCRILVAFAVGAFVIGSAVAQESCYYTWERIRLPDLYCVGWDINNNGHVAGEIVTGGDTTRAFWWTPEMGVDILPLPPGIISMSAYAINDLGQMAGTMSDGAEWFGFVWSAETGYTVIDFPHPSTNVYITDINDNGEVVGSVFRRVIPGPWHWDPFVWHNGDFTFFGELTEPYPAFLRGVNELGDVVGYANIESNVPRAFIIRNRLEFNWLSSPLDFIWTRAEAINNYGLIVGDGRDAVLRTNVAVAWTPWGIDSVPPPSDSQSAYFTAVNDRGHAVGRFTGAFDRPFYWAVGTAIDLLPLLTPTPAAISGAEAINDLGQVVVAGGNGSLLLEAQWLEGDLTGDCHISLEDLAFVLADFGSESGFAQLGDVNLDGEVDLVDLALVLSRFGE
ncbi:MAG: hypothetical protein ACKVS9_08225 [Phycisphaerae bacterium]